MWLDADHEAAGRRQVLGAAPVAAGEQHDGRPQDADGDPVRRAQRLVGTLPLLPSRRPSRMVRSGLRQRCRSPVILSADRGRCRGNPRRRGRWSRCATTDPHRPDGRPVTGASCCRSRARRSAKSRLASAPGVSRAELARAMALDTWRPSWPARGRPTSSSSPPTRADGRRRHAGRRRGRARPGARAEWRRTRAGPASLGARAATARWRCCWPTCPPCGAEDLAAA